jgi:hypothetical protein
MGVDVMCQHIRINPIFAGYTKAPKERMTEMEKRLAELPKLSKDVEKESLKYFQRLKRRVPKNLDVVMQELHEEVLFLQKKTFSEFRSIFE